MKHSSSQFAGCLELPGCTASMWGRYGTVWGTSTAGRIGTAVGNPTEVREKMDRTRAKRERQSVDVGQDLSSRGSVAFTSCTIFFAHICSQGCRLLGKPNSIMVFLLFSVKLSCHRCSGPQSAQCGNNAAPGDSLTDSAWQIDSKLSNFVTGGARAQKCWLASGQSPTTSVDSSKLDKQWTEPATAWILCLRVWRVQAISQWHQVSASWVITYESGADLESFSGRHLPQLLLVELYMMQFQLPVSVTCLYLKSFL